MPLAVGLIRFTGKTMSMWLAQIDRHFHAHHAPLTSTSDNVRGTRMTASAPNVALIGGRLSAMYALYFNSNCATFRDNAKNALAALRECGQCTAGLPRIPDSYADKDAVHAFRETVYSKANPHLSRSLLYVSIHPSPSRLDALGFNYRLYPVLTSQCAYLGALSDYAHLVFDRSEKEYTHLRHRLELKLKERMALVKKLWTMTPERPCDLTSRESAQLGSLLTHYELPLRNAIPTPDSFPTTVSEMMTTLWTYDAKESLKRAFQTDLMVHAFKSSVGNYQTILKSHELSVRDNVDLASAYAMIEASIYFVPIEPLEGISAGDIHNLIKIGLIDSKLETQLIQSVRVRNSTMSQLRPQDSAPAQHAEEPHTSA